MEQVIGSEGKNLGFEAQFSDAKTIEFPEGKVKVVDVIPEEPVGGGTNLIGSRLE